MPETVPVNKWVISGAFGDCKRTRFKSAGFPPGGRDAQSRRLGEARPATPRQGRVARYRIGEPVPLAPIAASPRPSQGWPPCTWGGNGAELCDLLPRGQRGLWFEDGHEPGRARQPERHPSPGTHGRPRAGGSLKQDGRSSRQDGRYARERRGMGDSGQPGCCGHPGARLGVGKGRRGHVQRAGLRGHGRGS